MFAREMDNFGVVNSDFSRGGLLSNEWGVDMLKSELIKLF